ncbi:hypothetical protein IE077_000262 [Cardiosporidium cionae]|uniref:Uncharacterized protein n=1 Tax=Cardiosporidium cionae TaxID=476202 RepID=A0ABQ7JBY5_9APIC|nr:hypothetical protein IE077_000262 [Cardiosporidium cionae]|eukprot:KAF8821526.1 hypothetical protein IE077_000262 [Cardiosporidium cionae]
MSYRRMLKMLPIVEVAIPRSSLISPLSQMRSLCTCSAPRISFSPWVSCPKLNKAHRSFATLSVPKLGHNLEDYYGVGEYATCIHSPMVDYIWWGWFAFQAIILFGALFHSNYYFSGRILPKNQGNTQLCEDSW